MGGALLRVPLLVSDRTRTVLPLQDPFLTPTANCERGQQGQWTSSAPQQVAPGVLSVSAGLRPPTSGTPEQQ